MWSLEIFSVESDVQRMVVSTVEQLGSLDVVSSILVPLHSAVLRLSKMVANAGICITKSILSSTSPNRHYPTVNLRSTASSENGIELRQSMVVGPFSATSTLRSR